MSGFNIIKESKFEKLQNSDLASIKGGSICISCMKRDRKVEIAIGDDSDPTDDKIDKLIHIEFNF